MWLEMLSWIDHIWSSKECVCCACDLFVWFILCFTFYYYCVSLQKTISPTIIFTVFLTFFDWS